MNEFMNGIASGLGFMTGVGIYNNMASISFQNRMIKNKIEENTNIVCTRVADILNNGNSYMKEYGYESLSEIGHMLIDDLECTDNISNDFAIKTIKDNYSKDIWHFFFDEEMPVKAWQIIE